MARKAYRPIRRSLGESEARNLLAQAYAQRQNCMEELWHLEHRGVDPLICALCRQTPKEMAEQAVRQIDWLDRRIEDLQRFLPSKVSVNDLLG